MFPEARGFRKETEGEMGSVQHVAADTHTHKHKKKYADYYLAKRNGEKRTTILVLSVFFLLPERQVESAQSGKDGRWIRFA